MDKRQLGWIFALTATLAYSTNIPLARGAIVAGISPTVLLAGRFGLAAGMFIATLSTTSVGVAKSEQRPLDRRGFVIGLLSGFLNGLTLMAFYWGLTRISASISSMIAIGLYPIVTLVILTFRGERFTRRNVVRLLLGLGGLYLLIGPGGRVDPLGILLTMIGAVLFACHLVSVQWFLRPYNTWAVTTLLVSAAASVVVVIWLLDGVDTFVPGWIGWGAIIIQGVVATYIGRLMTYAAINLIGSGQFAMLSPLETLLTILWSVLFLGEWLAPLQWGGAVLILSSVLLAAEGVRLRRAIMRNA